MTLGGNVCIRNGLSLDYCFQQAIESLLPVCESVTVCDGQSDDGTQEVIREWMTREPKIKLCVYPWPNPKADVNFWTDWINFARGHIREDFEIQLDADEVLHESSYPLIQQFKNQTRPGQRVSLWMRRYNFWQDAQHLIPTGVCCSDRVVRMAPQSTWLPSDGPDARGAEATAMAVDSGCEIFHYGFLRKPDAFFRKAKALQSYFFGSYDDRLAEAERELILAGEKSGDGGNWMRDIKGVEWVERLVPFKGTHPSVARQWLTERGYAI